MAIIALISLYHFQQIDKSISKIQIVTIRNHYFVTAFSYFRFGLNFYSNLNNFLFFFFRFEYQFSNITSKNGRKN